MRKLLLIAVSILLSAAVSFAQTSASKKYDSIYTSLHEAKACRTIEENVDEGGWILQECPGVGGYKLEVMEGDLRQSINVISPNGTKTELDLWYLINGGFSYVGPKAEWRVTGKGKQAKPHALIVRFTEDAQPDANITAKSYLVVVKLTKDSVCITDLVDPQTKNQNAAARKLADASAAKPCRRSDTETPDATSQE